MPKNEGYHLTGELQDNEELHRHSKVTVTSSTKSTRDSEQGDRSKDMKVLNTSKGTKRTKNDENKSDDLPAAKRTRPVHHQNEIENSFDADSCDTIPPNLPPSIPKSKSNLDSMQNANLESTNSSNLLPLELRSDGDGSFSSVCSSPSQLCLSDSKLYSSQDGNTILRKNNSVASMNSAASSTSSASIKIPPAPPSTPVKGLMNFNTAENEADIYVERDQQNYNTGFCNAEEPRFQDMATPTPNNANRKGTTTYASNNQPVANTNNGNLPCSSVRNNQQDFNSVDSPPTTSSHSSPQDCAKKSDISDDFLDWKVGPRYKLIRILGHGSYGQVGQARDLEAEREGGKEGGPKYVAIKRINSAFEQEVDALRLFREIHILRRLRGHECIIQLLEIVPPESDNIDEFNDLYLVFEYVDTDLYKLIMSPQYLTTEHIRTFLYQMLTGLKYMHSSSVIHRDLKPANILLNEDCSLKICDFGLARIVNRETVAKGSERSNDSPNEQNTMSNPTRGLTRQLTKHVVTRWYRAPELILIQPYTSAVDVWSLGCILAELLSMQEGSVPGYQDRVPLFPGGSCYPLSGEGNSVKKDERLDQLSVILGVIGTPLPEDVQSVGNANHYIKNLSKQPNKSLESLYPAADNAAIDLLRNMLQFNPKKRCTTEEALEHEFLRGVRRKEMERTADRPLIDPNFLNSNEISLEELKRRTFEEVMLDKNQKHASTS